MTDTTAGEPARDAASPAGVTPLWQALHGHAAGPSGARIFVAAAEIDRFAALRRTLGYALSTQLMARVCDRIRAALPDCDVGRTGRTSVEFAFHARSADEARARLMMLGSSVANGIDVDGLSFDLSLTMGFADATHVGDAEEAIDRAEAALGEAQRLRLRLAFAGDAIAAGAVERLGLIRDLQGAIAADQFNLVYQPKLHTRSATIGSAEALLRWYHPVRGEVSPSLFIPIAEETGIIRPLTEWVIARAMQDQRWFRERGLDLKLDVNVSGSLVPDLDFAAWLLARVADTDGRIGFEITETAMIADPEGGLLNLQRFAEAGIRLAIDDYGSGFCSLSYLQKLPFSELKIDRSFISGLATTQRDPLLVRSTIDLAHALDMEVTAEGVEMPDVLALLQVMGCDLVQGYLIARPLPREDLLAFARRNGQAESLSALPAIGARLRGLKLRSAR